MRPKDELYLKAVARLKRSNHSLEMIVRAILLNPDLRKAAREECCDLEGWEEDMVASAACRRAVTDIEGILEWLRSECSTRGCTRPATWEIEVRGAGESSTLYYACNEHLLEWEGLLSPMDGIRALEARR